MKMSHLKITDTNKIVTKQEDNRTDLSVQYSSFSSSTPSKKDFSLNFERNWPLLLQGFSFPMHDDIVHVLNEQCGKVKTCTSLYKLAFCIFVSCLNVNFLSIVFIYAMYTVSPVGDNFFTKVFRYFFWWYFFVNTRWDIYFKTTFVVLPWLTCFFWAIFMPFHSFIVKTFFAFDKFLTRCFVPKKRRRRRKRILFQEQAGINMDDWDKYVRELTLLETLRRILFSVTDKSGIVSALVMYAQAHSRKSILGHIAGLNSEHVSEIGVLLDRLNEQSGIPETAWITDLRSCFTNWKRYRTSKIATSFLGLVNYIVSVGLCDKASLTFNMGKLQLFSPTVMKRQLAACDLLELLTETALGFIEGGWRVYTSKSLSAFFVEEDAFTEFEDLYNSVRAIHGFCLTGNLRKYADIDENEYELKLDTAIEKGERLLKKMGSKGSPDRKFVSDRLDRIRDCRNEFIQVRTRGGLRVSPFGISLYGDSAVGKSTLNQLTYEAIGQFNQIDVTPERVATWADNDKYASNIRASTNVIIFDDFGNTTPKFMDFSPCYRLIQCVNNALFTAPMAEANLKGKVGLHPWIVTITTNVEHLHAHVYSEKPESILRRFYHVKVEVKDEFLTSGKLDESKVFDKFGIVKIPDMWKISVRSCHVGNVLATGSDRRAYELKPVIFEGRTLAGISVNEYLRWVQIASKKHYDQQRGLVETMRRPATSVCESCGFFGCTCLPVINEECEIPILIDDDGGDLEEHCALVVRGFFQTSLLFLRVFWSIFFSIYWAFFRWVRAYIGGLCFGYTPPTFVTYLHYRMDYWRAFFLLFSNHVHRSVAHSFEQISLDTLLDLQNFYASHWIFDFVVYLPDSWVNSNSFVFGLMYQRRVSVWYRQRVLICLVCFAYLNAVYFLLNHCYLRAFMYFSIIGIVVGFVIACERIMIQQELLRRRSVVPGTLRWLRNHYVIALSSVLVSIYAALSFYKKSRILQMQGNLVPKSMSDIDERDKEVNPWAELVVTPIPMSTPSKTTTCENLISVVAKNIVNVESSKYIVKGFFLTSNVLIVPFHYLTMHRKNGFKGDIAVKCYRTDKEKVGGNFRENLSEAYSYRIPDTDFIAFYSPSSGSVANIMKFLPLDKPSTSDARFILKEDDGEFNVSPILFEAQMVEHTSLRFQGGRYKLPFETAQGMCMSPIVSNGKGAAIIGFHLCGKKYIGGAGYISQSAAACAVDALSSLEGCILAPSNGIFPEEQYGCKVVVDTNVHRKSAVRHIKPDNSLEVYGTTTGRATPNSCVVDTLISPVVTQVTGVPQQWGPPKVRGADIYPWQAALDTLAHPSLSLGSFIRPAVICYRSIFPEVKADIPELFYQAKPLSDVETVSGIDGRRFIDAMNMKTSPGWPLSGRKDKWIIDLDPKDFPHISRPRTFVPEIWNEVDRCVNILKDGERPYFIWKACLKDEPTKLTKTKVRVFQSAPIALQLLIRKYFLPIVRIIQCNPLSSECLVGANAEGPEWEQLNAFMNSKGPNILAGDYSKYDQRMPAQLVIAAFDVLIWIAGELCDYSAESLLIMRGIVGEVAFPLMAYNGDLLQLFGSNPSGQNLTVIINSIANVLLMRSCYYHLYPQDIASCAFRKYCSLATYGDDVKGSVSPERSAFNHISYAHFLRDFDIVFTMPDKESVATEYMVSDDADFLKRKNRFHEELGINVGVLAESSIFKRLHSHLLSKELSLEMQSAVNIDSSLHDWFYYGRDMFEYRKQQLYAIAFNSGILHLCRGFDVSYDQRVLRWNQKYRPDIAQAIMFDDSEDDISVFDIGYEFEMSDISVSDIGSEQSEDYKLPP